MLDLMRIRYGMGVVLAGLLVVVAVFVAAILKWTSATDVAAAVGSVSGVVGTIVGAYFGVQAGAAGKEKTEQQRDRAQAQARELAGITDPDAYRELRANRGDLFGPVGSGGTP